MKGMILWVMTRGIKEMFTKPRWTTRKDGTVRYQCNDAVYGWITKKKNAQYTWSVAMTNNYGTSEGISPDLIGAKKCIKLLIDGTKSSLYLQEKRVFRDI